MSAALPASPAACAGPRGLQRRDGAHRVARLVEQVRGGKQIADREGIFVLPELRSRQIEVGGFLPAIELAAELDGFRLELGRTVGARALPLKRHG